jgi:hypothetical protein
MTNAIQQFSHTGTGNAKDYSVLSKCLFFRLTTLARQSQQLKMIDGTLVSYKTTNLKWKVAAENTMPDGIARPL